MNRQDYEATIAVVRKADVAYYVQDAPIMSDQEYDDKIRRLQEYEAQHPDELDKDSPTQRVGGRVSGAFQTVKHPRRMLSLANVFSKAQMEAYGLQLQMRLGKVAKWMVEPKLDGLTLVVRYEHGRLTQAVTRGDGDQGEDVLATARTIRNLPLRLEKDLSFYARGEVLMPKSVFAKLNEELVAAGKPPFANPRNAAAGSLRQKDPAEAARRKLAVCFYDVFECDPKPATESAKLVFLNDAGLPSLADSAMTVGNTSDAYAICHDMSYRRNRLDYDIDGMVIKVDSVEMQEALGEGTKTPNWAYAYKFPAEHVATVLREVQWQTGRTGAITPVAVFDPVVIGGSTVDHASLHNIDYVRVLNARIGDKISVYKAAEIIPQVASVLEHAEDGKPVLVPDKCPGCGGALHMEGAALMCGNENCEAGRIRWLQFFASREHMDIKGLGEAVATQLVEKQLCEMPADLYRLTKEQLMQLDGFSDKKAESLLAEIERSKGKPAEKVLAAIGIDMLGDTLSGQLIRVFKSIRAIQQAKPTELTALDGVAGTTAASILYSINSARMKACIDALEAAGLQFAQQQEDASQTLAGLAFCITGTLSVDRETMKGRILAHGGKFQSSVSSKTSYLVAGEGGGEKRSKAAKLNVTIIGEAELEKMINGE